MTIDIIPIPEGQRFPEERKLDLTASRDIPAICGVHPYVSAMQVYAEKKGIVEPQAETGRMRGGRWFQPAVKEAFREGLPEFTLIDCTNYYRDPKTRIGCTPDYFAWPGAIVPYSDIVMDAKFVSKQSWLRNWLCEEDEGELIATYQTPLIPIYIQFQNLVQVHHTDAKRGMIGALVHDSFDEDYPQLHALDLDLRGAFEVGGTWDFIEECAAEFWRKFERDEPPAVMPRLDAQLISKIYSRDDGPALDLSDNGDVRYLLSEIDRLKQAMQPHSDALKPLEAEHKELRTSLKAMMGFSQKARCGPWDISCKLIERAPVAATSYRDLRIKKAKR